MRFRDFLWQANCFDDVIWMSMSILVQQYDIQIQCTTMYNAYLICVALSWREREKLIKYWRHQIGYRRWWYGLVNLDGCGSGTFATKSFCAKGCSMCVFCAWMFFFGSLIASSSKSTNEKFKRRFDRNTEFYEFSVIMSKLNLLSKNWKTYLDEHDEHIEIIFQRWAGRFKFCSNNPIKTWRERRECQVGSLCAISQLWKS